MNPEFGTLADLRTLVDAAHSRGLAVMLDWVANHTAWDNAWITAHPDWYLRDAAGTILSPPNTNLQRRGPAQLQQRAHAPGADFGHEIVGVHGQRGRVPLRLRRRAAR